MIYTFLKFKFDTRTKELFHSGKTITLSKQHQELLLFFLNHQEATLSKKELMEHVWNGRTVAGNTVDQSLSKLKKILNDCQRSNYFETVYGQGVRFLPDVSSAKAKISSSVLFLLLSFVIVLSVFGFYYSSFITKNDKETNQHNKLPLLMVVPQFHHNQDIGLEKAWLNTAVWMLFEQLVSYERFAQLKANKNKPANLNHQQYLDHQWAISHALNTLSVNLLKDKNNYTISLVLTNKEQLSRSYKWSANQLSSVIRHAEQWLNLQFGSKKSSLNLITKDSYLLELYMRGLSLLNGNNSANKQVNTLEKASHFFELIINDKPTFHLARLELIKIKIQQAKTQEALALLDVLDTDNLPATLALEATKSRSKIYSLLNNFEQASELLKKNIARYKPNNYFETNELRYELSIIYLKLKKPDFALRELQKISVGLSENPELSASVFQHQAFIYLNRKEFQKAEEMASKSLELYNKLGDSMALAANHRLLAKIASQQHKLAVAELHLAQALSLYRSLPSTRFSMAEGLNEMIPILIDQGQLSQAAELNHELQQLAKTFDKNKFLIDSKFHGTVLAMMQKNWTLASQKLQEHKTLVLESNNPIARINNQILNIKLLLNQNIVEGIDSLFLNLQTEVAVFEAGRLPLQINILQAQYYVLKNNSTKARTLLISAKALAQSRQDTKTLVEINNRLAQQYLTENKTDEAMKLLEESMHYNPLNYPYLLLKSKANMQLGKKMKALELALELKLKSSQLWSSEDESYLTTLVKHNKSL